MVGSKLWFGYYNVGTAIATKLQKKIWRGKGKGGQTVRDA